MIRPLTIALDGRTLFDEVRRGIAKTTIFQYRELAAIRPEWQFHVYYQEGRYENPFAGIPNIHCHKLMMKGDRFRLWERVALPLAVMKLRPDFFHAVGGLAPRFLRTSVVTTIHDLIPIEQNRTDPDAYRWANNVKRTARRAQLILTPSEFSKSKIVELCDVPSEMVHVVPWATMMPPNDIEPIGEHLSRLEDSAPKYDHTAPIVGRAKSARPDTLAIHTHTDCERLSGLEDSAPTYAGISPMRHVLHFGMADPRKNTAKLIRAWAQVPMAVRATTKLVILGLSDTAKHDFSQQCQDLGLPVGLDSGGVGIFGYVPEEEVRTLLAGATLLAYPTEYEGFGLPILDGFAAGVPVLTGQSTSLPEVAGDAAMLVNVHDVDAIAQGLTTLLQDEVLRGVLTQRGLDRAKLYTWRRVAEATAELMEWISLGPTQVRHGPMAPT